jgi:hypothetical protein
LPPRATTKSLVVSHHFLGHLDAFLQREHGLLVVAGRDCDDHRVEQLRRPADDVFVAECHRVEGAGVNGDHALGHGAFS